MDRKCEGENKKWKILVGATGSVASIKLVELVNNIREQAEVKVILTNSAKQFVNMRELEEMKVEVYLDESETKLWSKRGDPVLHVQLRKWADAMVIAPLSGNTLAKLANGFCDNLITLVCRCWDMTLSSTRQDLLINSQQHQKRLQFPLLVSPAMNTMMWSHPITSQHLSKLTSWGFVIIDPIEKTLMCGDTGKGAMNSIQKIAQTLFLELSRKTKVINTSLKISQ